MKIDQINRRRYRREGAWIAAIGVFALCLIMMISLDTLQKTRSVTALREVTRRTSQIVAGLDRLTFDMTDAAANQRGLLLTHAPAYDTAFQQATLRMDRGATGLMAQALPGQELEVATELRDSVRAAQAQMATAIAEEPASLEASRQALNDVRQNIAELRRTAEGRLHDQQQATEEVEDRTARQIFLSIGIAAVCIALALAGTVYEAKARRHLLKVLDLERLNAVAANRTKSSFLAYTSHELRTPLNAIIGFSEFMMMEYAGPLSDRQKQYLSDIRGSGLHLQALIGDILDLTKAEAGKITLSESEIDLANLVGSCLKLVEGQAKEAEVSVSARVATDLPLLYADELRCKQVLINLAINAINLTRAGGEIVVEALTSPLGELTLLVRDPHGPGIPREDLPKMIEPYFRSGIEEPSHKGYGLGMPLARKIMQLHGGSLSLMSETGTGTSAQVIFPASRSVMVEQGGAEIIPLRG